MTRFAQPSRPTAKFRGCSYAGISRRLSPPFRESRSSSLPRIFLVLLALFSASLPLRGAEYRPSEYDVKAAYLLNFGKFMRIAGPGAAGFGSSFDICIVGDSPIEAPLRALAANEQIGGRPVRVLHLRDGTQAKACQVAYLSGPEGARLDQDLEELRGTNVLTVSDAPDFLARGGMIQFVLISDHVRFSVSLEAVRQTRLVLSSEFLRVAYSVAMQPGKEGAP